MNFQYKTLLLVTVLATGAITAAHAAPNDACQDLVKDCFVEALEQRDACIQTVSTNSLCLSSEFGTLVKKRAQFSDGQPSVDDQGPAFLGPQMINKRCVSNFDTTWSAALVKGPLSADKISTLSKALDECVTPESKGLPRP